VPVGRASHDVEAVLEPSSRNGAVLRTARNASTLAGSQWLKLASVRFFTFPPSRKLSRKRIAGGEFWFGTVAMYVSTRLGSYCRYDE
jgi:hypothetical protein